VKVGFRRLERDDFPLLSLWFSRPYVKQWWREETDLASIEARYGPSVDRDDPTEVFIAVLNGEAIGMAQRYLFADEPAWAQAMAPSGDHEGAAGIDYLIGDERFVGTGLGPVLIDSFVASTWERYPSVSHIAVAVLQGNRRSWRALEKAGFERSWAGEVVSDDPSDAGPSFVYVRQRP
jgi:aminoglycoside 6'-N-acetyltransferase